MSDQYIIVSVTHNSRHDKCILLWRPDNKGYTLLTHKAGRYDKENVMAHLAYYNGGSNTLAVPESLIEGMSIKVPDGHFDAPGDAVPNTVRNWKLLIKNAIVKPEYETLYQCKYSRHKEVR